MSHSVQKKPRRNLRRNIMLVGVAVQFVAWVWDRTSPFPAGAACMGAFLVFAGAPLRVWATVYMARRWPKGNQKPRIFTTGPFALLRHPRYIGSAMINTGLVLATGWDCVWSPVAVLLIAVPHLRAACQETTTLALQQPRVYAKYQPGFACRNLRRALRVNRHLPALPRHFFFRQIAGKILVFISAFGFAAYRCWGDLIGHQSVSSFFERSGFVF